MHVSLCLDPGSAAADKRRQREGRHVYRGEERRRQSRCSVSVCGCYQVISLALASTVYIQVAAALVHSSISSSHQSVRESGRVCPWAPRLGPVPGECSGGVRLPAPQHERLHGRQPRRRRRLVSSFPRQTYARPLVRGVF